MERVVGVVCPGAGVCQSKVSARATMKVGFHRLAAPMVSDACGGSTSGACSYAVRRRPMDLGGPRWLRARARHCPGGRQPSLQPAAPPRGWQLGCRQAAGSRVALRGSRRQGWVALRAIGVPPRSCRHHAGACAVVEYAFLFITKKLYNANQRLSGEVFKTF